MGAQEREAQQRILCSGKNLRGLEGMDSVPDILFGSILDFIFSLCYVAFFSNSALSPSLLLSLFIILNLNFWMCLYVVLCFL